MKIEEDINPGFNPVPPELRRLFEGTLLPLVSIEGDKLVGQGTGFLVTSFGLMVTARHIFEMLDRRGNEVISDGRRTREYNLYALYRSNVPHDDDPSKEIGGLVPIIKVFSYEATDVAFCLLQPIISVKTRELYVYRCLPINLLRPVVGQRVLMIGYLKAEGLITDEGSVDYSDEMVSSDGVVETINDQGRGTTMMSGPNFLVNGRIDPGMSGGPILFDGKMNPCGIMSSGMDANTSHGSMLWPAMGITMDLWPPELVNAYELSVKGHIQVCEGLDRITITKRGELVDIGYRKDG
ncbi:MAG: trypsin-like peptidase domain-containing protein [Fimbriimonadaceae bacterium]